MLFKSIKNINTFLAGDHTRLKEVLHPKNDQLDLGFSLAHASLKPGTSSLAHVLEKCSETYYFLKGKGMITVGKQSQTVRAGDLVFVPEGEEQFVENQGDIDLDFLCIVSPPWYAEQEMILQNRTSS